MTWRGNGPGDAQGIFLRRFDASGLPQGGESRVNETIAGTQSMPDIAMQRAGRHVVAWDGNGAGDDAGVFARRYSHTGQAIGGEIPVNASALGSQSRPAVAMMPDGGFVVAWQGAGPGDDAGIFLRRFDEFGTPHAGEVLVNTASAGSQAVPAVAIGLGGEIRVVWEGRGEGDDFGVFARAFARPDRVHRAGFEPLDGDCPS